ncbi:MAG: class F sortase [Jatrophihabitantaceae bacterium]
MSETAHHGRRGRQLAAAAAIVLVAAGVIALLIGVRAQQSAPQPPAAASVPSSASSQSAQVTAPVPAPSGSAIQPKTTAKPATKGPLLAKSVPIRLEIPQLQVSSELLQLGINADQTVQVPPLGRDSRAGWYKYSPTPGQLGPSVLLGHVDSAEYGPGVFFKLGALRPGSTVTVTRSDRTTAVFRVDRVVSYRKNQFPTLEVYGNTDSAQLRLITCGGKFDLSSHNYEDNIVAFATLVSSHPA